MIVTFEWPIKTLSGKSPDGTVVYESRKNDTVCVMRRYVKPKITDHNRECGAKLKQAAALYKSVPAEFKESLRVYARAFNTQLLQPKKDYLCGYNIFIKALCRKKVELSTLDSLESVAGVYGTTITDWIAHGLLEKVKGKMPDCSIISLSDDVSVTVFGEHIAEIAKSFAMVSGDVFHQCFSGQLSVFPYG